MADGSVGALRAFGEYRLIRRLATGGMAEIFLAKQLGPSGFERDVVIKRLKPELYEREDFLEMFLEEARLAARLTHPNVAQIHDVGCINGHYFICMEYLPGEDLQYLLNATLKQDLEVPAMLAAQMIAQAAQGLQYAHELEDANGVPLHLVHRDISPSNLFVTYQGHVKLLDFGIARASSAVVRTAGGRVKGKTPYLAPELLSGAKADARSDIYALGLTMYVTLAGQHPFLRDNPMATMRAICDESAIPIQAIRSDVSDDLAMILDRAIARDPGARFQSAGDFASALEHYLMDFTTSTANAAARAWMKKVVGPQRIKLRSCVPTLAVLQASGVAVTGFTDPGRMQAVSLSSMTPPAPAHLQPPPLPRKDTPTGSSQAVQTRVIVRKRRRWRVPVAVALAALGVLGVSTAAVALLPQPTAPLQISVSPPDTRPVNTTLEVQCEGAQAALEIDGVPLGECPAQAMVEPGRHQLIARVEGRAPVTREVDVIGNEGRLVVLMDMAAKEIRSARTAARKRTGKLTLDTLPWTRVYRGHRLLGETPLVEEELPFGKHRLRLSNPEQGIDRVLEVYVAPGTLTVKRVDLR